MYVPQSMTLNCRNWGSIQGAQTAFSLWEINYLIYPPSFFQILSQYHPEYWTSYLTAGIAWQKGCYECSTAVLQLFHGSCKQCWRESQECQLDFVLWAAQTVEWMMQTRNLLSWGQCYILHRKTSAQFVYKHSENQVVVADSVSVHLIEIQEA